MKHLTQCAKNAYKAISHNIGELMLAIGTIAILFSFGYSIYVYHASTVELNRAYAALDNGNYAWAMEQFQYVLDGQETLRPMFESYKIIRSATAGLKRATTAYHYNSALEYYADENWEEAIYHFGQVIDYRDSLALLHNCLDGYAMTYHNENAPG